MSPPLRALVTAGGTRDLIDDVRVITNLSTGRFGKALASALADRGVSTTLLGNHALSAENRRGDLDKRLHFLSYDSFQDLSNVLQECAGQFDLILMAAAVSDYSPVRQSGKMSSSPETVSILMTKNPKILSSLREWFGPKAVIVGFKLLSSVSKERLISVARNQCQKAALDFTIANDLAELGGDWHPVTIVTEDSEMRVDGPRKRVAAGIAKELLNHSRIQHRSSEPVQWPQALNLSEPGQTSKIEYRDQKPQDFASIFDHFPSIEVVVRSKAPILIDEFRTKEAAWADIERCLSHQALTRAYSGAAFTLGLPNDESLLALDAASASTFMELGDFECPEKMSNWSKRPIFKGPMAVGWLLQEPASQTISPWIIPRLRGRGYGDQLVEELNHRGWPIALPAKSTQFEYFLARGYGPFTEANGLTHLLPPAKRTDLRRAGSVCLFNPLTREILLGQRLTEPWKGYWSFPGGNAEPGEDVEAAARRELYEETGITAPISPPLSTRTVFVGAQSGTKFYKVTNFQILALSQATPQPSEEMDARWCKLDEASNIQPMAAGTRRILDHVQELFS
jgi:phosphopantothenate---cysteine ligase (CTP)